MPSCSFIQSFASLYNLSTSIVLLLLQPTVLTILYLPELLLNNLNANFPAIIFLFSNKHSRKIIKTEFWNTQIGFFLAKLFKINNLTFYLFFRAQNRRKFSTLLLKQYSHQTSRDFLLPLLGTSRRAFRQRGGDRGLELNTSSV